MSKRLQSLIDAWAADHVLVEEHADRMDPSFSVSHRIQVPPLRKTCTSSEYAEECISSYNTQGDIASSVAAIHSAVQRTPLPANPLLSLCAASRRLEAAL